METKCNNCHLSSKQTEGWWTVRDYKTVINIDTDEAIEFKLCPRCYRNRSLLAYRDTLLELINDLDTNDDDRAVKIAMDVMKIRCIQIIRNTKINE